MPYSFREDNLDRELTKGGMGAAFQGFMGELLAKEHNNIAIYPSEGKDGAIDISREHDGGLVVYECKYIGDNTDKTALARWKEVAVNLDKYITSPDGPPNGQGQYGPWYNKDKPITRYEFCISSELGNVSNVQALEEKIQTYFESVAKQYDHLSHLSGLKVKVFSMNLWGPVLKKYPQLILKWYPNLRPNGFSRFEDMQFEGTFRSYLDIGKLPYYSRKQCIESHPSSGNSIIQDEDAMIRQLETRQTAGLILTGTGGVGKSRLMIELGRLALKDGWIVLRTTSERKINQDVFSQLTADINPQTKVLFLIDYIETLDNFQDFIETLSEYNEKGNLFFCYIGTCRSQYYTKTLQDTPDHKKVDLSPAGSTKQWFEEYRNHTVRHILKVSGIEDIDKCRDICRRMPVLAVFLSFLHSKNRNDDIGNLIKEQDFGKWVRKRLRMTIGSLEVKQNDYNLALLVAQFPMKSVDCLMEPDSTYTNLFHALKKDGWVEKIQDSPDKDEQWAISHDVFADEIIISYLREADLSKQFFKILFKNSSSNDTLHSALVSTERIAFRLDDLKSDDWFEIVSKSITEIPDEWKEVRNNLLMISMLDLEHKIRLLEQHEMFWTDAEKDLSFHGKLGWMARRLSNNREPSQDCTQTLSEWLKKAVPYATGDNYLINSGLLLCPEEYKDLVLDFICSYTLGFQTHFSIVSWLNEGLPLDSILEYIHKWLDCYPRALKVSFVIEAWLKAGGDKEQVWSYLEHWLKVHSEDESAQHVYCAWLNADGDIKQIWPYLENWMRRHSENKGVSFICVAWLKADGDKKQIWSYLEGWLKAHCETENTQHFYSAWLKAGVDTKQIWSYLESWLKVHSEDRNASFLYETLLDVHSDKEKIWPFLKSWLKKYKEDKIANNIYESWLNSKGNLELIWPYCDSWLKTYCESENAHFLSEAWIKADGSQEQIWPYLERWFQQHCKAKNASYIFRAWVEKEWDFGLIKKYVFEWLKENFELEECEYTFNRWLDAGGNKEQIWPYVEQWLKKYNLHERAQRVYIAWLKAGGNKEQIWPYLDRWFQQNCKTEDASYPFRTWVEKEGDFDLIKKYVFEWVKENFELEHCDFKFNQLLDAGGNKEQIWPYLKSWLEKYGEDERAQHVYRAWLKAKGNIEQIWSYLKSWLEKYGEDERTQHVYRAWLNAGGDIGQIRSYASLLKKHSETENACFVYEPRSKSQNNKKQMWPYLESWLEMHCETKSAEYVYYAWLNNGKNIDVLQEYIGRWLKKHLSDKSIRRFVRLLARINPLPKVFVRDILSWCRNYPEDENSLWCITSLSDHLFTKELQDAVIQTSETLVCQALSKEYNLTEVSVGQINTLFSFLISHKRMQKGQYFDRVNELFLKWLKCPDSYGYASKPHQQIEKNNYFIRFKIMLDNGKLDILKDASAIERFLQWVNNWHIGNKKLIQQNMNTIKRNYPKTQLWDIVKFTD